MSITAQNYQDPFTPGFLIHNPITFVKSQLLHLRPLQKFESIWKWHQGVGTEEKCVKDSCDEFLSSLLYRLNLEIRFCYFSPFAMRKLTDERRKCLTSARIKRTVSAMSVWAARCRNEQRNTYYCFFGTNENPTQYEPPQIAMGKNSLQLPLCRCHGD